MGVRTKALIVGTGLVAAALTGCVYPDVKASLALNTNDRIDANLELDFGEALRNSADLTPEERESQRDSLEQTRNCVNGAVSNDAGNRLFRFAVRDKTEQQLRDSLDCLGFAEYSDVRLQIDDGFFRDTRTLTVILNIPIEYRISESEKSLLFPTEFIVEMPGKANVEFSKFSPAVELGYVNLSDNSVSITFNENESVVADWVSRQGEAACAKSDPCIHMEPHAAQVEFQISSSEYNFGLGDILAFFSILFGSGIAVTVGSRFLAVRTEQKTK